MAFIFIRDQVVCVRDQAVHVFVNTDIICS